MCQASVAMAQAVAPDLLLHASFDKGTADADFAKGHAKSSLKVEAARHFVEGAAKLTVPAKPATPGR